MSIPDSAKIVEWLTVIQKIDWRTEAAIVTTATSVLILAGYDILRFGDLPLWFLQATAIIGLFFFSHMLFRGGDYLRISFLESRKEQVRRKYNKLSDSQRELLTCIYNNRNRKFRFDTAKDKIPGRPQQVSDDPVEIPRMPRLLEPRELEELVIYNYIQSDGKYRVPEIYSVTENGWCELEKNSEIKSS